MGRSELERFRDVVVELRRTGWADAVDDDPVSMLLAAVRQVGRALTGRSSTAWIVSVRAPGAVQPRDEATFSDEPEARAVFDALRRSYANDEPLTIEDLRPSGGAG